VKIRQVDDQEGRRTFVMVCEVGDDPVESLTAAAKRFDLRAATLSGIGAFSAVTLGFFDHARRDYRRRVIREQVEVVSLLGNVALDGGEPRVHAHVVVGRSDGGALGGHLLGGSVDPTLEVTLVRVQTGDVAFDNVVSMGDRDESAWGISHATSVDRLMNSAFRQVVTQIVEQVAAKMALHPRDVHVRFALVTR